MKTALFVSLGIFTAGFLLLWVLAMIGPRRDERLADGAPAPLSTPATLMCIAGALVGGVLGFLFRPSLPLIGQLPFSVVITAGANLTDADASLLKPIARQSLGYLIAGTAVVGFAGFMLGRRRKPSPAFPGPLNAAIGFATNFFDTLGIGSFATTSAVFKFFGLVRDERIPGTLNVGHTLPSILQAFIYIAIVKVDVVTLTAMIAAACVGAWLGAGVVSGLSRRKIQIGMGTALLALALIVALTALKVIPGSGTDLALSGTKLVFAVVCNAILGALMTLGIGLYAPCMVLISLLGMDPTAAFPIMMGSCAFLMPVGSARFIRTGKYDLKAALGLAVGGPAAVLLAAFIVESLPKKVVPWLVVGVVIYTAAMMLYSAARERKQGRLIAQVS
jgi:uncharacterized membrane protein YfcA